MTQAKRARQPARVLTIDGALPFADTLAAGLLERYGGSDSGLADLLVLLPTRRAGRSLREAFLRQGGGTPMLLPRMAALGDVEEDELLLAPALGEAGAEALEIPPEIDKLQRLGLLTQLILKRAQAQGAESWGVSTPGQAAALATELARLLDSLQIEEVGIDRLAGIVPERFADHWRLTLRFLGILSENWPALLREIGAVDPATRRNLLLRAQAQLWRAQPPAHPVIAAGSTGSIPATRELLLAVASLPQGSVVLPGLDRHLSAAQWRALEQSHPQFGLRELLAALQCAPDEVEDWRSPLPAGNAARVKMWSQALQPAEEHELPHPPPAEALQGMTRLDCATPQQEALAIALILRGVLETPGRSGALVTADRALARRVAGELQRWDIAIDDSAGTALGDTPPAVLLRLLLAAVESELAPVPLLSLLQHPLCAVGLPRAEALDRVRALDQFLLRGPRPGSGLAGLRQALVAAQEGAPQGLLTLLQRIGRLLDRLEPALQPLQAAMAVNAARVPELARALVQAGQSIAATADAGGDQALWQGQAGEALQSLLMDAIERGEAFGQIDGKGWPGLFDELLRGQVVRSRFGLHPRLYIWGPLEARLQRADVMVLGGLNEGSWPPLVDAGPWLTRPMREELGLPLPERRIGLAAHDFVQAACAPVVYLSRAERAEGAPTVKARWLARLDALLGRGENAAEPPADIAAGAQWLHWADLLDQPADVVSAKPPRPAPPLEARPRQLSATAIELWRKDPYALYARTVLRLRPLDPLDMDPTARDRGNLIHGVLDQFLTDCGGIVGADAEQRLIALGWQRFLQSLDRPSERAFWWPRFERAAHWFVATQRERQEEKIALALAEAEGRISLHGPGGAFVVTAKADRIDRLGDGTLEIIDYKTGASPSPDQVAAGYAPQLPLEALIALQAGFARDGRTAQGRTARLSYWRLRGKDDGGEIENVLVQKKFAKTMAEYARPGESLLQTLLRLTEHSLIQRIARYDNPATPYLSQPRPSFAGFGEYDHLARVKEWSVVYGDD